MSTSAREFFEFITDAKTNYPLDKAALNSLDIVDSKAGGLAGLIGGFSAAATVALQLGEPWKYGPNWDVMILAASLVALALSGWACALSLNIISHHDEKLIRQERSRHDVESALTKVYRSRVTRYRYAHFLFMLGAGALALGVVAMLFELPPRPAPGAVVDISSEK